MLHTTFARATALAFAASMIACGGPEGADLADAEGAATADPCLTSAADATVSMGGGTSSQQRMTYHTGSLAWWSTTRTCQHAKVDILVPANHSPSWSYPEINFSFGIPDNLLAGITDSAACASTVVNAALYKKVGTSFAFAGWAQYKGVWAPPVPGYFNVYPTSCHLEAAFNTTIQAVKPASGIDTYRVIMNGSYVIYPVSDLQVVARHNAVIR